MNFTESCSNRGWATPIYAWTTAVHLIRDTEWVVPGAAVEGSVGVLKRVKSVKKKGNNHPNTVARVLPEPFELSPRTMTAADSRRHANVTLINLLPLFIELRSP